MKETRLPLLLTAEDLARELGISVRSVWRRHAAGQLPGTVRIGRCVRWIAGEIEEWICQGCPPRNVRN